MTYIAAAAQKTSSIVGREEELEKLKNALYRRDRAFVVVLLRGRGGLGKTRLLEEVLWRSGNFNAREQRPMTKEEEDFDWQSDRVVVSNLIDMMDARLHARRSLLLQIRDSFRWPGGAEFTNYDQTHARLRRLVATGTDFQIVRTTANESVQNFEKDIEQITQKKRLVWVFDTVEQLNQPVSEWLIERDLLRPEDMESRSYQWLVELIQAKKFKNITLILAGRAKEGERFFKEIVQAATSNGKQKRDFKLIEIDLPTFSEIDTRGYFATLADDWSRQDDGFSVVKKQFSALAEEASDEYKLLHFYTGGIPVRLALYAQLIVESKRLPEHLKLSYTAAKANITTEKQLGFIQWQIEDAFIDLIFGNPGNLRLMILLLLVRAPRGLTARQIHYVLDCHAQKPSEWAENLHRIKEIESEMKNLLNSYLVKLRSLQPLRLGLQDEIYRIYAEHMAPQASPQEENLAEIWQQLGKEDQIRYFQNRLDEQDARQELYKTLKDWAASEKNRYLEQKRSYLDADEGAFEENLKPHDLTSFQFRILSDEEIENRVQIQGDILASEIEEMVYALLLDPERNFNRFYVDLANDWYKAEDEYADFLTQTEMWRVLHDPYALKFLDLHKRKVIEERGETPLDVLRRAVHQEDVARWLKRFVLLKQYDRAIEFAEEIEKVIENLQYEQPEAENSWRSWRHTLVQVERQSWAEYARILASKELSSVIVRLRSRIQKLVLLAQKTTEEVAIVRSNGFEENGFAGDPDKKIEGHPAEIRLRRIISRAFNTLGYGYITQGQVRLAVQAYGQALYYLRDTGADSHRATVLNNLSRALSDLGHDSGRMCLDGLNIRRQMGAEGPIAYSYNTLGLIYDDQDQPEDAWIQSAKAVAYFRRSDQPRGLGLALLQLGEALRHIAAQVRRGQTFITSSDSLYTTADKLLNEALMIFEGTSTDAPIVNEPLREVEVLVELGCLYRDWYSSSRPKSEFDTSSNLRYREALTYLDKAAKKASTKGFIRLHIDAVINMAWTHYYQKKYEAALTTLDEAINLIDGHYLVTGSAIPDPTQIDEVWVFNQLSKGQALRGRIAMDNFQIRVKLLGEKYPGDDESTRRKRRVVVHNDEIAQGELLKAAEAYSLGIDYARLFSVGAAAITLMKDNLYGYLRTFNRQELDDFHRHVVTWAKEYPENETTRSALCGGKITDQFLHQFFGIPTGEEPCLP